MTFSRSQFLKVVNTTAGSDEPAFFLRRTDRPSAALQIGVMRRTFEEGSAKMAISDFTTLPNPRGVSSLSSRLSGFVKRKKNMNKVKHELLVSGDILTT